MWHSVPRLKKCQQKQSNFSIGAQGFINTPSSGHWRQSQNDLKCVGVLLFFRSLIAMVLFHDGGSRRPGVGSNAPSLGNTKHHKDVATTWSIHMTQYQIFASVSQHSMSENHGILHGTYTEEQEKKQNIASSSVWNLIMGRCVHVRVQINVFGMRHGLQASCHWWVSHSAPAPHRLTYGSGLNIPRSTTILLIYYIFT